MEKLRRIARPISHFVILAFLWLGVQLPAAHAGIVGTETLVSSEQAQQDRAHILKLLERKDVQEQLVAYGVDAEQAKARVNSLTDAEMRSLAGQMDQLPAGGDSVVGILFAIFIILLITDILGLTNIFPFVKHRR
ncbi:MAG: PA2779 family protein [Gammaproteobacteria bacterium]|nr:PA2779 family protein [Gammaproteobacteria bacterium]